MFASGGALVQGRLLTTLRCFSEHADFCVLFPNSLCMHTYPKQGKSWIIP